MFFYDLEVEVEEKEKKRECELLNLLIYNKYFIVICVFLGLI